MKKRMSLHWQNQESFPKNESVWTKIMKGSLLGAFVAGIFMANLMGREAVSNAGILNDYFVEKFQYTEINGESMFFYVIGERVPMLLLLLLLAFTSLGIISGILMLTWQGFSIGFMLSTAIAKYGGKGILLVLGGMFPQYLFYFPVYLLYCCLALCLRQKLYGEGKERSGERRYIYGAGLAATVGLLLVYVAGIFLESYLNPIILKKILKIF